MEYSSTLSDCSTENMMPRILSVCTLPTSDNQWEKAVTVNLVDLPLDQPQTECINDDFIDLTMEVEEETMVDVETSDSELHEDLQEFSIKNLTEDGNLKQTLVAALSRGICDDISQFYREQKNLSNVKWSKIDNQACTERSIAYQIDGTEETSYSSVKVKVEANSFPFENIKTENIVTDTAHSVPFANIKIENITDTAYSSEADIALRSHKGLQSLGALDAANTGSVTTVIKKESGRDNAEAPSNLIVKNGLQYQMLTNNKMCDLLMNRPNPLSHTAPHPVCVIKSVAGRVTSVQKLKNAKKKMQKKQTSMKTHVRKRCLVCNIRCSINENRKLPSLPFCKKCKMVYFSWLARRCTISNYVCLSGKTCRIDYRQEKTCLTCHLTKFLTVLSAAQMTFKGPFRLNLSGRYTPKEACEQRKYDWSIIRDEILLQEAVIFQPRVLLTRVDGCTRSTHLPSVGQAEFTKQVPLKLTNLNGQITGKSSPRQETKISVICKLLSNSPSPLRLTPVTSCRKSRKKRCSYSVVGKKLPEVPNTGGLSRPRVQQYGITGAIIEGNTQLIKSDTSEAGELTSSASLGEKDFAITAQEDFPSLMTSNDLSGSVQNTSMPTIVGDFLKDVLDQHVGVDAAAVTDRLVSRYSGRKIRPIVFSSYSYDALQRAAKPRRPAARVTKKKAVEPSKVSVFVCGHICSICNATKTCEWLSDHKYTKTPPLSSAMCDDKQEVIHDGTSSKTGLILKKLSELNELLAESTNMLLELKNTASQHESTPATKPLTLLNSGSAGYQLQPLSQIMVQTSSKHDIPTDINTSLPNSWSVSPTDNLLGESSQLLQKLTQNVASTSQPKVHSFPHTFTGLQQSPQLPPPPLERQSPQVAVSFTDLEHIHNTKTVQSLAVADFIPELSISSEAPPPNCLFSGMKSVQSYVMPRPSATDPDHIDLIAVFKGTRLELHSRRT